MAVRLPHKRLTTAPTDLHMAHTRAGKSAQLHSPVRRCDVQMELGRNRVRAKRIDVWQQAVDTEVFNPRFRSQAMRDRMSGGRPDAVILTYVGRLGAGEQACSGYALVHGCKSVRCLQSVRPQIDPDVCGFWSSLTGKASTH